MYECNLFVSNVYVGTVKLKSITQVCKFVSSCNLDLLDVHVISPKNRLIDAKSLKELWNA